MLKTLLLTLLALGALCEEHDPARVTRIRTRTEVSGSRIRGKGEPDEDDREAIVPTREETSVTVVLHQYDSPRTVVRECLRMGAWPATWSEAEILRAHPAPGCMAFDLDTKVCTIHTLKPRYVEDDERLQNQGHELEHCFHGAYHKQEK